MYRSLSTPATESPSHASHVPTLVWSARPVLPSSTPLGCYRLLSGCLQRLLPLVAGRWACLCPCAAFPCREDGRSKKKSPAGLNSSPRG